MPLTTGPHFSTSLDAFTAAAIPASSNHLHSSAFPTPGRSLPPLLSPSQFQSCALRPSPPTTALVLRRQKWENHRACLVRKRREFSREQSFKHAPCQPPPGVPRGPPRP